MNFYAIIIGTEILNGRRVDKHFEFLKNELSLYGHELFASLVIKDDKTLIANSFEMVKKDPDAVLFCFGGIGSTPDDLTREIASEVFRGSKPVVHQKFLQDILDRFKDEAYPHRIHMAEIPPKSELIFNPVNNMSGFALDKRYFFTPGFPSMSHPMLKGVIKQYFSKKVKKYRSTLFAKTSENTLISIMQQIPQEIELSSLPIFIDSKPNVELSLSSTDKDLLKKYFELFEQKLKDLNVEYEITQSV